ncbi:MAG: haloalkane dehalogenase [Actinomycetota bacterium]
MTANSSPAVVRAPDDRFVELPGWPYTRREVLVPAGPTVPECDTLSVAFIDEGPTDGIPVVMLHGEPTWGYLYRHMVRDLLALGYRVLVPDQIGFGRSDQPCARSAYAYAAHVAWMGAWWDAAVPDGAVFFGQDWGSLVGLAVATQRAERVRAIVIGNGILARRFKEQTGAFAQWQEYVANLEYMDCGAMVDVTMPGHLSAAERAAYDAPFPDRTHQMGALVFPSLVPNSADTEAARIMLAAWDVLDTWEKPFATRYGTPDPITGHGQRYFIEHVPGAARCEHGTIEGAGHFSQELGHAELAAAIDAVARMA